ncbi:High affinity copper uptake protein 1 [Trachymyrmex septentrionalis]|uniref:Copper transport protein n=1 Tax=Trachymyrmex septentrionalis TaxID=34720 RepID=A0A151JUM1_9HYME|nr:PREDICTED: high affinity copper uptake protein 1 isoform X2 [Trachymyrmex septentrionalis]KYN36554.1 High affinity copper uptake protein 1 [Trachymyrmex septentrionalis]
MSHDHHIMDSTGNASHGMHMAHHINRGSMDDGNMNHGGMDHGSIGGMHHGIETSTDSMCSGMGMHGMSMTFHTGYCEVVLFENWKISSIGGLVGSMIGIAIMAALYEGLKYYREYLFWKTYNALQYRSVTVPSEKNVVAEDNRVVQPTMMSWMHLFQTFLHIIQIVLSYFLMLIFMTYNVWLCCAVVSGAAVGYFLFGWKKSVIVDVTEHCH